MPRIYVAFAGLDDAASGLKVKASRVGAVRRDLKSTVKSLNWQVRHSADISRRAQELDRELEEYQRLLMTYYRYLNQCHNTYQKLENWKYDYVSKDSRLNAIPELDDYIKEITQYLFEQWWKKRFERIASKYWSPVLFSAIDKLIDKLIGSSQAPDVSQLDSVLARFTDNLSNPEYASSLVNSYKGYIQKLAGAKGVGKAVAGWAGLAASAGMKLADNISEAETDPTMSGTRIAAETITETVVSTVINTGAKAIVGAAIAAAAPAAAGPVVIAVASTTVVWLADSAFSSVTGTSITEFISDHLIDFAAGVGQAVKSGNIGPPLWFSQGLAYSQL